MKPKQLESVRKKILELTFKELRDKEIARELVQLFNALGDILRMVKLPKGTMPNQLEGYGVQRLAKNKVLSAKIRLAQNTKKKERD